MIATPSPKRQPLYAQHSPDVGAAWDELSPGCLCTPLLSGEAPAEPEPACPMHGIEAS